MRMICRNTHGFTLIEIIATLVISGVVMAIAGMGMSIVLDGYFFASDTSKTATNVQAVLSRLEKEFTVIQNVNSATSTSIDFDGCRTDGATGTTTENHILSWSGTAGDPLLLDGNRLLNNVTSFSLTFDAALKIIEVSVTINVAQGIDSTFSTRIRPRNL